MTISRWILLIMRSVLSKSWSYRPKHACAIIEIMYEIYAFRWFYVTSSTEMCYTYCFFTTTMVTWKLLSVMLYVHRLFCLLFCLNSNKTREEFKCKVSDSASNIAVFHVATNSRHSPDHWRARTRSTMQLKWTSCSFFVALHEVGSPNCRFI